MNALQVSMSDDRTIRPGSWPIEIVLFLALLGTINILFFPGDPGFMAATPHPLWLIILPVAARYGFLPGLTAGVCCAAIHFSLTIHAAPDPTWADLKHFSIWKLPFLFTLIGGALGEVREVQKRRYSTLRSRHLELSREAADLQERHALLLRSKEELDLRIITQEQTLSTLYDSTHSLRLLDEKAILPALLDLLSEQLNISQAAAYRISEKELVLSAHIGSSEDIPTTLALKKDVAARVLDDRRTWTIRDNLNEIEAGPQFLIMAPILAADQKTVFGILAVRDIPFEKFTPSGIKMITLLADWGGTSLDNARRFSVVKDQLITDESGYAFTFAYFQSRIMEEVNRSKRYNSIFSILYVELPGQEPPSRPPYSVESAIFMISRNLRGVDLVFRTAHPHGVLVMLPSTNSTGADHTAAKLSDQLNNLAGMDLSTAQDSAEARIGTATFSEQLDSPRALLETAVSNLQAVRSRSTVKKARNVPLTTSLNPETN